MNEKHDPGNLPPVVPTPTTPENFGVLVAAVLAMQHSIGELKARDETLEANQNQQHLDSQELKLSLNSLKMTVKFQSALLIAIGGGLAWLILRVWELLLPFMQARLKLTH